MKLAEGQSKEERIRLGSAYHRVIGIKKYEELRQNLESVLLKMKRETLNEAGEAKWMQLSSELKEAEEGLRQLEGDVVELSSKKETLKQELGSVQEHLLREGSMVDILDKNKAIEEREDCIQRNLDFKNQLKDYLEYAPFAISGGLFRDSIQLAEHDFKVSESTNNFIHQNKTIDEINQKLENLLIKSDISEDRKNQLLHQMKGVLFDYHVEIIEDPVLLDVDKDAYNKMTSVSRMLYTTFQAEFKTMREAYKRNKQKIDKLNKILHREVEEEANDRIAALKKKQEGLQQDILTLENQIL